MVRSRKMTSTNMETTTNDSENLCEREKYIEQLENKLDEQDAKIRHLTNEIEKYKHIIQPLTSMVFSLRTIGLDDTDLTSKSAEKRIKKIAISAEPTDDLKVEDLKIKPITKVEK